MESRTIILLLVAVGCLINACSSAYAVFVMGNLMAALVLAVVAMVFLILFLYFWMEGFAERPEGDFDEPASPHMQ